MSALRYSLADANFETSVHTVQDKIINAIPAPAVRDTINAAMDGARAAAANVAVNANNVVRNPRGIAKNIQVTVEGITVPAAAAVTHRVQSHWRMIVPLACGAFITLLMLFIQMYNPTVAERGHLASLIPLVMIMGERILSKAISVTTANPRQDCPHLGCGWLSWCLNAVTTSVSNTTDLIAKPENACRVVNLEHGHTRTNNSFVLSRILRDLESRKGSEVGGLSIEVLNAGEQVELRSWAQIFRLNSESTFALLVQLIIGFLAFSATGDITPLLFFSAGVFLMEAIVNFPAWSAAKFSARKDNGCRSTYALMRGNGHRNVFIIRNAHDDAWNLEDMASGGSSRYNYASTPERAVMFLTFVTFLAQTISATFMSDASARYILYILAVGTIQNVLIAALPRPTWAHGVWLASIDTISNDRKVMVALKELEEKYPGIADPLVKEFFPGGLREDEQKWWDDRKQVREQEKADAEAEKARLAAELKEDIKEEYDVEEDVSTKNLEKEMEKLIRGQ